MSAAASDLAAWAERNNVNPGSDALNQVYAGLYEAGLDGSRSRGFNAYAAALDSLPGSPDLEPVFNSSLRTEGPTAVHCSTNSPSSGPPGGSPLNTTKSSLDMAAWLFNTKGARYVGMVDVGIGTDTAAAYDGHFHTAGVTFGNLYNLLKELSRVTSMTPPPSGRISIDDTLIILNTEFGRTIEPDQPEGRNHYGRGYVVVLLGGPIQPTVSGEPKRIGSFDWMTGSPLGSYTAANLACVALTAAGIDPHVTDNFAVGELPPGPPYEAPFFQA
jgi:hypothetical protein